MDGREKRSHKFSNIENALELKEIRRVVEKSNNLNHVLYVEAFQAFPRFFFCSQLSTLRKSFLNYGEKKKNSEKIISFILRLRWKVLLFMALLRSLCDCYVLRTMLHNTRIPPESYIVSDNGKMNRWINERMYLRPFVEERGWRW